MEQLLSEWRQEIGIALIALFFIVMVASRKAARNRSLDRRRFLESSGFVLDKSREAEVADRLALLLPHWKSVDALTLLRAQTFEMQSCHFTKAHGREICLARFCDKITRPSGTATDVERPRTLFLMPCDNSWPAFALTFEVHARYPELLKTIARGAEAIVSSLKSEQLILGINDEITLSRVTLEPVPAGIVEIYASDPERVKEALRIIFSLQSEIFKCGTVGIYNRNGYLALESIYYTPSNEAGPKYLVSAEEIWSSLQSIIPKLS